MTHAECIKDPLEFVQHELLQSCEKATAVVNSTGDEGLYQYK